MVAEAALRAASTLAESTEPAPVSSVNCTSSVWVIWLSRSACVAYGIDNSLQRLRGGSHPPRPPATKRARRRDPRDLRAGKQTPRLRSGRQAHACQATAFLIR